MRDVEKKRLNPARRAGKHRGHGGYGGYRVREIMREE
jgi:hypothetical protein